MSNIKQHSIKKHEDKDFTLYTSIAKCVKNAELNMRLASRLRIVLLDNYMKSGNYDKRTTNSD